MGSREGGQGGVFAIFGSLYILNTWKTEMKEMWENVNICLVSVVGSWSFHITSYNFLHLGCFLILNNVLMIFKSSPKTEY